jgi:hypothetical protein
MDDISWLYTPLIYIGIILVVFLIGFPHYRVWFAHKKGLADLARAQNEQQIQVANANGRLKAADLNKQAAIIEAEAVAKQIEVIGTNLKNHDLYLRWQWIRMMEEREGETIYVPTEANLPILEATRLAPVTMPQKGA